jgi:hypothetical protein
VKGCLRVDGTSLPVWSPSVHDLDFESLVPSAACRRDECKYARYRTLFRDQDMPCGRTPDPLPRTFDRLRPYTESLGP